MHCLINSAQVAAKAAEDSANQAFSHAQAAGVRLLGSTDARDKAVAAEQAIKKYRPTAPFMSDKDILGAVERELSRLGRCLNFRGGREE